MRTEQEKRGGGNIQVEAGGKVLLFLLLLHLPWVGMPEQNGNHASQMVRSSPLWGKRNAQVCSKYLVVVVVVVRTNFTTRDDRFPIRRGTSLILRERGEERRGGASHHVCSIQKPHPSRAERRITVRVLLLVGRVSLRPPKHGLPWLPV